MLEHPGPDPGLDVLAAPVLQDHRLDALEVQQLRQRQACGPGADDRHLRPRHAPASRSKSAACPWPDADAHRREAVAPAATAKLVQQRGDEPGAAHAERVPDRDRAAVDVHPLLVEAELAHDGEALRRERLVQLDEIELVDGHPGAVEELAHGRDGPDAHHRRVDAGGRRAGEHAERLDPERPRPLLARDHERRGTVVDPARVARGDRPALPERRLQRRELLDRRVRPRMLVVLELSGRRRARRRSGRPRAPPPSAAGSGRRTHPDPRATRPSARPRSPPSLPSRSRE